MSFPSSLYFLVIWILANCWIQHGAAKDYKRVCYYTNWSQYRPGIGRFVPDNIDPRLCSHIIYAFAKLTSTNELSTLEWNDEPMYKKINDQKQIHTGLKTLIAVGGWNAASAQFTQMVESRTNRNKFIRSTLDFLRKYNFDGLDLDWEYPAQRGGRPQDKTNFALLVKELRNAFDQAGRGPSRGPYLLTAAVPAGRPNIDAGYDVTSIAQNFDFINLMTYDLHGAWDKVTGENSPLYARTTEQGAARQLNMAWAANYWVQLGAPRDKLIIGMATYGRTFTLANANTRGLGAPATGAGTAGPQTRERGFLAFYEICQQQDRKLGQAFWDAEQRVPYFVAGNQWVGYDNEKSIFEKAKWVKDEGFGGAMIWSLDSDDFRSVCSSSHRRYPLLSTINDVLGPAFTTTTPGGRNGTTTTTTTKTTITTTGGGTTRSTPKQTKATTTTSATTTTASKTTTTSHSTTTKKSKKGFSCAGRSPGFYRDPTSCKAFFRCVSGVAFHYQCPPGLLYNARIHLCDWPFKVNCNDDTTAFSLGLSNRIK